MSKKNQKDDMIVQNMLDIAKTSLGECNKLLRDLQDIAKKGLISTGTIMGSKHAPTYFRASKLMYEACEFMSKALQKRHGPDAVVTTKVLSLENQQFSQVTIEVTVVVSKSFQYCF